jgi:hypothetical protein
VPVHPRLGHVGERDSVYQPQLLEPPEHGLERAQARVEGFRRAGENRGVPFRAKGVRVLEPRWTVLDLRKDENKKPVRFRILISSQGL